MYVQIYQHWFSGLVMNGTFPTPYVNRAYKAPAVMILFSQEFTYHAICIARRLAETLGLNSREKNFKAESIPWGLRLALAFVSAIELSLVALYHPSTLVNGMAIKPSLFQPVFK